MRKTNKACRVNPLHVIYFAVAIGFALVYNSFALFYTVGEGTSVIRTETQDLSRLRSSPEKKDELITTTSADEQAEEEQVEDEQQAPNEQQAPDEQPADKQPAVETTEIDSIAKFPPSDYELPEGFQFMLKRAKQMKGSCETLPSVSSEQKTVDVPSFGIVEALESYSPQSAQEAEDWQCVVPPSTECDVERFSVIFLGYGADRLNGMKQQIRRMLASSPYKDMVEEVILVWNNPKPLNESGKTGELLYHWATKETNPFDESEPNRFRVFFPIELGFSSSLMNRYHPLIKPKSKALLYYDDDGPFYAYRAIKSNFELWKRNSNVQTGAMARAFTLSERQQDEKNQLLGGPKKLDDRQFVSHCRDKGDEIHYDYRHFENFHANMVRGGNQISIKETYFVNSPILYRFYRLDPWYTAIIFASFGIQRWQSCENS